MKETPILFSSEMVRAILDGRKTQTRRIINPQPKTIIKDPRNRLPEAFWVDGEKWIKCRYGQPGDRLWVRERFFCNDYRYPKGPINELKDALYYYADGIPCFEGEESLIRWKPSIYMPRWASRITLEIDEIRVERVQDITEDDAMAEGCEKLLMETRSALNNFMNLWNFINSKRGYGWDTNPWVWVVKFHRLEDFENEN
mgnify:CR=1 FL=1